MSGVRLSHVRVLATMPQIVIREYQGQHGFRDRYGPDPDARVVPTRRADLGGLAVDVDRTTRAHDARGRLERQTDDDVLSGRNSARASARVVRQEAIRGELVTMLAPRCSTAPNPAPISTPLTALIPIMALARSASSRSNTGSPRPGGTPLATTVTRAPIESPSRRSWSMQASSSATATRIGAEERIASIAAGSR